MGGDGPARIDGYEVLEARFDLASRGGGRRAHGVAILAVALRQRCVDSPVDPDRAATLDHRVITCMRRSLERVDSIARLGPLRYLVLLERLDEGSAFAIQSADLLIDEFRERTDGATDDLSLTANVGVSYREQGASFESLARRAETALDGAVMGGGDLVGFSSGPLHESSRRQVAIERAIVEVVERDELHVAYQPQLDARDGSIVGVEALLRWNHEELGMIPPGEFIPMLEASGQIDAVGAWVLERACRDAARWAEGGRPLRVSVNVSASQLRTHAFIDVVRGALSRSELPPSLLELELTEGVLVENPISTRALLEEIRRQGVRIAVDDFGTGYASLSYIRHFPMDTLKIDREFVRGLPIDVENAAITSAIVALARSLRLELVAEGVEREAEEEFLHSLGCYVIQGFLHARPMPADELQAWLAKRPWA